MLPSNGVSLKQFPGYNDYEDKRGVWVFPLELGTYCFCRAFIGEERKWVKNVLLDDLDWKVLEGVDPRGGIAWPLSFLKHPLG